MNSERARIEVAIDWQSRDAGHRERYLFDKINFWRDFIPAEIEQGLKQGKAGTWVHASIDSGEVLPAYSHDRVVKVPARAASFKLKNGKAIKPFIGHFYPRKFIAGHGDIYSDDMRPMRLVGLDDDGYTCDLNHPLAHLHRLEVSARVVEWQGGAEEHGGRCNDIVLDALESGPGFQAQLREGKTDFFHENAFRRVDETGDEVFYAKPRMVGHLDSQCSSLIAELYSASLPPGGRVLDLMSSCESHLPSGRADLDVTGLGMNAEEMAANSALAARVVHDLNAEPVLPFGDAAFDAVICTASVEYLVRPFDVFREIARVCKPGGPVMMSFSERWFPPKAITLWSEVHPFERMAIVLDYFRESGLYNELYTETVRGYLRPEDDKYADSMLLSDPVFFVRAKRA